MTYPKRFFCILYLITAIANAQIKRIQFISSENRSPLQEVAVYNGNLLVGKSDLDGFVDISKGNFSFLYAIKDDYKDVFIKVSDLEEKVMMTKVNPILMQEVVICKKADISIRKILNRVQDNFKEFDNILFSDQGKYKNPHLFTATNKMMMGLDTLHYLNGLMKYEKGNGWPYYIGKYPRLIKKFSIETVRTNSKRYYDRKVYSINKKNIELYHPGLFYGIDDDQVLSENILEKRSNYDYAVTDVGEYYKLDFKFKNHRPFDEGWFTVWTNWRQVVGFNGYLIIDKKDFGIYEFKAYLSDPLNLNLTREIDMLSVNKKQEYIVTGIEYNIKYQKGKNGNYHLEYCFYDEQSMQTQGEFKGRKFSFSTHIEAADNDNKAEFVRFSMSSFELK